MAQVHGKSGAVKIDATAGGALQDLSAHCKEFTLNTSIDLAESSTMGDAAKEWFPGLYEWDASITFVWDNTASTGPDAVLNAHVGASASCTIELGPEGSTTGKIKYSGEAWLTSRGVAVSLGDMSMLTCAFKGSGALTRGTFA